MVQNIYFNILQLKKMSIRQWVIFHLSCHFSEDPIELWQYGILERQFKYTSTIPPKEDSRDGHLVRWRKDRNFCPNWINKQWEFYIPGQFEPELAKPLPLILSSPASIPTFDHPNDVECNMAESFFDKFSEKKIISHKTLRQVEKIKENRRRIQQKRRWQQRRRDPILEKYSDSGEEEYICVRARRSTTSSSYRDNLDSDSDCYDTDYYENSDYYISSDSG